MADKKISALTGATTPLAGTEVLPIVQGASTVKVAVSDLTAGRAVSASSVTSTGNSTFNTAANIGWRVGARSDNAISAIYPTAITPDSTNYALQASSTITYLNSPGSTSLAVSDNAIATATATALTLPNANLVIGTAGKGITTGSAIPLGLGVNNSVSAVTIDTSSNTIIGGTSQLLSANASRLEVQAPVDKHGTTSIVESVGYVPFIAWNRVTSGDNSFAAFGTETSYTGRGGISYNRTAGLVVYATTSDYRAKEVFGPVENSGATIDKLKIYMGKMHGATETRPMLIAHEAQEVTPYAVTGTKDAVNEDGSPEYQQIDVSTLVPLLIAEVQSLRARVAQLEGK